jgi:serine/threonine protein phosphatase PrpC
VSTATLDSLVTSERFTETVDLGDGLTVVLRDGRVETWTDAHANTRDATLARIATRRYGRRAERRAYALAVQASERATRRDPLHPVPDRLRADVAEFRAAIDRDLARRIAATERVAGFAATLAGAKVAA